MRIPSIELIAKRVVFYSDLDETSFFAWVEKVVAVRNVRGEGDAIIIECDPVPIGDDSLRELVALFYRYGIESGQLDVFLTESNRRWFAGKNAYWRKLR